MAYRLSWTTSQQTLLNNTCSSQWWPVLCCTTVRAVMSRRDYHSVEGTGKDGEQENWPPKTRKWVATNAPPPLGPEAYAATLTFAVCAT